MASGLFDRNGNYVNAHGEDRGHASEGRNAGGQVNSGITVKSGFDVTPGSYFVRIVVRDAEGQKMAALNGAIEIP